MKRHRQQMKPQWKAAAVLEAKMTLQTTRKQSRRRRATRMLSRMAVAPRRKRRRPDHRSLVKTSRTSSLAQLTAGIGDSHRGSSVVRADRFPAALVVEEARLGGQGMTAPALRDPTAARPRRFTKPSLRNKRPRRSPAVQTRTAGKGSPTRVAAIRGPDPLPEELGG